MQDEFEDMLEESNEIQEVLGRSYGVPEDVDEADLEAGKKIEISRNYNGFYRTGRFR